MKAPALDRIGVDETTGCQTYTDNYGVVWPLWAYYAKCGKQAPTRTYNTYTQSKSNRKGHPGYKLNPGTLDQDDYLWFRAVYNETNNALSQRAPSLVKPWTYFQELKSDDAVKVPVTVLNMAYHEAAMLARRTSLCPDTGLKVHQRVAEVSNDRVWYRTDKFQDVWVGARLSTLTNIDKGQVIQLIHRHQLPNINWSNVIWD